jgi:hypothetical protein
MTTSAEHEFWTSDHQYEKLARMYEQNIERTSPEFVTTDRLVPRFLSGDDWAATSIDYYEYRGPRPSSRNL